MNDYGFDLSGSEITFEEAVRYFGNKVVLTKKEFRSLEEEYRTLAFTVSGYTKIQILNHFYDALLKAIEDGETMYTFRERMNEFLSAQGYEGLTNFQADNIFRTNVQTAYQVGHYKQMTDPAVLKLRPYWMYNAVNDSKTRPSHLAMDGKVFPADSPVWDTWYPPNGYRCRCTITSLSKRQVEQMGLNIENSIPRGAQMRDGRFVHLVPDRNFRTNPAKVEWSPDMKGYPETLVKAYQRDIKPIKRETGIKTAR